MGKESHRPRGKENYLAQALGADHISQDITFKDIKVPFDKEPYQELAGTSPTGRFETEPELQNIKPEGQQGPPTLMQAECPDSTLIRDILYNPETRELCVTFRTTGKSYKYLNIPQDIWDELLDAKSAGAYFIKNIRNGGFGGMPID